MPKVVADAVLDGALNVIKSGAIRQAICSTQPANYAAIAGVRLAEATMASGDFTIAAGATPSAGLGRKVTIAAKSGVSITGAGTQTAGFVVLHDNSSVMHYVTTCTGASLTNGGTVNIPSWVIEIAGPV
jgi:hypothetical protein